MEYKDIVIEKAKVEEEINKILEKFTSEAGVKVESIIVSHDPGSNKYFVSILAVI